MPDGRRFESSKYSNARATLGLYLTMIITEFQKHPATSTPAGRPPLAATPTRNSKTDIRHVSAHTDVHRQCSIREAGCRSRALGRYLAKVRWNHAKVGCLPCNVDSVRRHLAPEIRS